MDSMLDSYPSFTSADLDPVSWQFIGNSNTFPVLLMIAGGSQKGENGEILRMEKVKLEN